MKRQRSCPEMNGIISNWLIETLHQSPNSKTRCSHSRKYRTKGAIPESKPRGNAFGWEYRGDLVLSTTITTQRDSDRSFGLWKRAAKRLTPWSRDTTCVPALMTLASINNFKSGYSICFDWLIVWSHGALVVFWKKAHERVSSSCIWWT